MTKLLTLSVLTAFIGVLAPEGGRRILKCLCALLLIGMMAEPVADALEALAQLPDQWTEIFAQPWNEAEEIQQETDAWIIQRTIRTAEGGITALIAARWGVAPSDILVTVETSLDQQGRVCLASVSVFLHGDVDIREIEAYLEETFLCPCEVTLEHL